MNADSSTEGSVDYKVKKASDTLQDSIDTTNSNVSDLSAKVEILNGDSNTEGSVKNAVAKVVDGAPEAYDTLKEIADYLSNNDDVTGALTNSLTSVKNTSLTLKINGTTQTTYKPDGNNQEFNVTLAGLGGATSGHNHNIENLTNFSQRVYDATVSRTAGTVLAAPASANGAATFRKLVKSDIPALDYLTSSSLSGYATESWVTGKNYLTSSSLSGYATETWVTNKGYLTSSSLNGYATQDWVTSQSYATQTWVSSQGFLTSHQSLDGYLKATSYGGYVAPTYESTQLGFREYPSGSLNHGQANMKGILVGGGSYDSLMFYLGGSTSGIGTVNQVYFSASPFSSGSYGDALIRFRDNSTDTHAHYVSIVADQNPTQAILTVSGGTSCYSIQTTRNIATPAVAETSDARYKVKQDDIYLNIDDIVNAPSMEFKWDRDKDNSLPEGIYYGTTAQYWEDKLPNIVSKTSDDGVLSLNYSKLGVAIGLSLAKEIKELKETVASLKEEIASLKSK